MLNIKQLNYGHIDASTMIGTGLMYIGLGWLFFRSGTATLITIKNGLILMFGLLAVLQLIGFAPVRKKRLTGLSRISGFFMNGLMAVLIYRDPVWLFSMLPLAFGVYALFSGIARFLIYLQYRTNEIPGRTLTLLNAIFFVGLGVTIIAEPSSYILSVSKLIAIFFILYGLTHLGDGIREAMPTETKNRVKRRVRMSLPVFLVALTPHKVLTQINKAFETDKLDPKDLLSNKDNKPFDLEVFVHVGEKGTYAFGHVDLCFEGKVMTYGCYDESTFKLFGSISDGVFISVPDKDGYIKLAQQHSGKTLFGFGLALSEEQKNRVREKITELYQNLYEWDPPAKQVEADGKALQKECKDYASILFKRLGATCYKFKKGPFKTYFMLNTNCVLLADHIVGQAGIDLVKVQGLISPGTYYDYFNREFSRKNSFVVSRRIYYNLDKEKRAPIE